MRDLDRRLQEAMRRADPLPNPEVIAWFDSLTIPALKWLNRKWRQLEERGAPDSEIQQLAIEADQRSKLDKAGLLVDDWWCKD